MRPYAFALLLLIAMPALGMADAVSGKPAPPFEVKDARGHVQKLADYQGKITAAGIETLHFAWAGSHTPGQPHYYRLHGPTLVIEYDNTQNGANHVHSVWHNPTNSFGQDLLQAHYKGAHPAAR